MLSEELSRVAGKVGQRLRKALNRSVLYALSRAKTRVSEKRRAGRRGM
jgi:hypothetical protein